MILRTLTLAAAAQGLVFTTSRPRTRLQAEKPAWADAVKDEAVAEDVVADSPSLFDFFGGASVNSEAAKALKEEMRKMTAKVDEAVADARKAQQQYAQAVNNADAPRRPPSSGKKEPSRPRRRPRRRPSSCAARRPLRTREGESRRRGRGGRADRRLQGEEAAAFERTAKLIEQREADVKKAVDENRALLAAAETEKNGRKSPEGRGAAADAAIKQAKSIADRR